MENMKSAGLKIVTTDPAIQRSAPVTIDTLPPLIHAVAPAPMPRRKVRRLDVDEVLARSLPKVAGDFEKAASTRSGR